MKIHTLKPAAGSRTSRKRIGRGEGSGVGGTSTKGNKGHQSRSGHKYKKGFEGGQMPLHRRLPKFGFTNPFRVEYKVVNLKDIQALLDKDAAVKEVNPVYLHAQGALSSVEKKVKVLGVGALKKGITVHAHKCSESAKAAIEKAGGKAIVIESK